MVTSPGGTTAAGLKVLEEGNIRATIVSAVEAATKRSKELASGK
jgi:pyrroline-5-carboxylate reductase